MDSCKDWNPWCQTRKIASIYRNLRPDTSILKNLNRHTWNCKASHLSLIWAQSAVWSKELTTEQATHLHLRRKTAITVEQVHYVALIPGSQAWKRVFLRNNQKTQDRSAQCAYEAPVLSVSQPIGLLPHASASPFLNSVTQLSWCLAALSKRCQQRPKKAET